MCVKSGCGEAEYRRRLCRDHFLYEYRNRYKRTPRDGSSVPIVVYAWIAPDGKADYVGRGIGKRPLSHRQRDWWTPQHILVSMTCRAEWEAMAREGEWIGHYQPRHNIEGYRHGPEQRRTFTGLAL